MRFLKFAQNSPGNDIHVKQESIPPFLGIVDDKKRTPFFGFGHQKSHFFAPENGYFQ